MDPQSKMTDNHHKTTETWREESPVKTHTQGECHMKLENKAGVIRVQLRKALDDQKLKEARPILPWRLERENTPGNTLLVDF